MSTVFYCLLQHSIPVSHIDRMTLVNSYKSEGSALFDCYRPLVYPTDDVQNKPVVFELL